MKHLSLRFALCAAFTFFACRAAPEPPYDPGPPVLPEDLEVRSELYVGSILSGPQVGVDLAAWTEAQRPGHGYRGELVLVENLPEDFLRVMAPHWRLVTQPDSSEPVRGISKLAEGARYAAGAEAQAGWQALLDGRAGRSTVLGEVRGVLLEGTTERFRLSAMETVEDAENFLGEWQVRGPVRKALGLALHAGPTGLDIGFALSNLAQESAEEDPVEAAVGGGRPGADELQREWVFPASGLGSSELAAVKPGAPKVGTVDYSASGQVEEGPGTEWHGELLFLLPSPFEQAHAKAVAIHLVDLGPADGEGLAQARECLLAAGAMKPEKALSEKEAQARALIEAIASLQVPVPVQATATVAGDAGSGEGAEPKAAPAAPIEPRGPLLYLANAQGGPLTKDLVLTADERLLTDWAALIPKAEVLSAGKGGGEPSWIVWEVERAAWVCLARRQVKDALGAEWQAILLRHAGEAARYSSTIEDAAMQSADLATMQKRLVLENQLFLEDSSPAPRVRAYDWLTRRGLQPEGFDPLASREERRDVLRALEQARLQAIESAGANARGKSATSPK